MGRGWLSGLTLGVLAAGAWADTLSVGSSIEETLASVATSEHLAPARHALWVDAGEPVALVSASLGFGGSLEVSQPDGTARQAALSEMTAVLVDSAQSGSVEVCITPVVAGSPHWLGAVPVARITLDQEVEPTLRWQPEAGEMAMAAFTLPVRAGHTVAVEVSADSARVSALCLSPDGRRWHDASSGVSDNVLVAFTPEVSGEALLVLASGEFFFVGARGLADVPLPLRLVAREVDLPRLSEGDVLTARTAETAALLLRMEDEPLAVDLRSRFQSYLRISGAAMMDGDGNAIGTFGTRVIARPCGPGDAVITLRPFFSEGGEFTLEIRPAEETAAELGRLVALPPGDAVACISVSARSDATCVAQVFSQSPDWIVESNLPKRDWQLPRLAAGHSGAPPALLLMPGYPEFAPADPEIASGSAPEPRVVGGMLLVSRDAPRPREETEGSLLVTQLEPEVWLGAGSPQGLRQGLAVSPRDPVRVIGLRGAPRMCVGVDALGEGVVPRLVATPCNAALFSSTLDDETGVAHLDVTLSESGEAFVLAQSMDSGGAGAIRLTLTEPHPRRIPRFAVEDTEGRPVRSADSEGQVRIVNFWGTQCGPCLREMPGLCKLWEKWGGRGLAVFAITSSDIGEVREVAARRRITVPLMLDPRDGVWEQFGPLSSEGRLMGIPQTFVFGRDGSLVAHHVGYVSGPALRAEVEPLIRGAAQ